MSRRKPKLPKNNGPSAPSASFGYGGGFGGGTGGYTAADHSTGRGYVYWPSAESKYALTPYIRREVYIRANWLVSNMGFARHLANTIPQWVGPLLPEPATKDEEWNEKALEFFMRTQGSRMIHDEAGMENFFTRQQTVVKQGIINGDVFIGLTKTTTGNARCVLYEAGQIGNGSKQNNKEGWFDGVQIDRYGKKKNFCVLKPGVDREGEVIPAFQMLHCGRFESPASPRGLTDFIHAINHLLDIREIDNDVKRGIKAANLVGFYLTNDVLSNMGPAPAAAKFQTKPAYNSSPNANVPNPKPLKFEGITEGGGNLMTLQQGQDLKTLHDERPHPNQAVFKSGIIRDCADGFGMPYEVIADIQGLAGPSVRFKMRQAEKALKGRRSDLQEQFCQPWYNYTIALAMKNGQLPICKDPDWWKCEWTAPSALTIDAGRDSASGMKELEAGGTTYQEWYAEDGQNWKHQLRRRAVAARFAMDLEEEFKLDRGTVIKLPELPAPAPDESKADPAQTPPKPAK